MLEKTGAPKGFKWFDYEDYSESNAYKLEIYLDQNFDEIYEIKKQRLLDILFFLLSDDSQIIKLGQNNPNSVWGGFTLDVWKLKDEEFEIDYDINHISKETVNYLNALTDSNIALDFKGFCQSSNLEYFLSITLDCVLRNTAPYSILIFDELSESVFYFHHTFSIGVYTNSDKVIDLIQEGKEVFSFALEY